MPKYLQLFHRHVFNSFFFKDNQLFLDKYQGKLFHDFRRQDQLIRRPLNVDLNHLPSDPGILCRFMLHFPVKCNIFRSQNFWDDILDIILRNKKNVLQITKKVPFQLALPYAKSNRPENCYRSSRASRNTIRYFGGRSEGVPLNIVYSTFNI